MIKSYNNYKDYNRYNDYTCYLENPEEAANAMMNRKIRWIEENMGMEGKRQSLD